MMQTYKEYCNGIGLYIHAYTRGVSEIRVRTVRGSITHIHVEVNYFSTENQDRNPLIKQQQQKIRSVSH